MNCIQASWPAPKHIRALTTTRSSGASGGRYTSLNLGDHVGDDPRFVHENREHVQKTLKLPRAPLWLKQVHGTAVVDAAIANHANEADGSFTTQAGVVCAVLTADCLPVFLCDRRGTTVAVLHAGWRGLAAGIIEAGIARMGIPGEALLAWLGPAIGPAAFEVGDDVREVFVRTDADSTRAFTANPRGRWFADIYQLARRRLERQGVTAIYGGEYCTVTQADLFYSYRRDGVTGRMASLIWLD